MRSGPRVPLIWSGPSVPSFTARPGCAARARGCVRRPRRCTPRRSVRQRGDDRDRPGGCVADVQPWPHGRVRGRAGPLAGADAGEQALGGEVDDGGHVAAAVRGDDRAVALGGDRERRADARPDVDPRAPPGRDAIESGEDAVGRADPQQPAAVGEGDAAREGRRAAALGLAEHRLLRAAHEAQLREVDEADALTEHDRRLAAVGRNRDGAGLGCLEVDGSGQRERRGVDDVDRAAARGEQARAVAGQRDRADRTGEVQPGGDGARREVEDRDAAARGDVRARSVGGGGDSAGASAQVDAGDDLVGRHVGEDELVRAGGDDDRPGVGGGSGGERCGGGGEQGRERGAEHVCETTRPGGGGCAACLDSRARRSEAETGARYSYDGASFGQHSASWPQMTVASGRCRVYARIAASERR